MKNRIALLAAVAAVSLLGAAAQADAASLVFGGIQAGSSANVGSASGSAAIGNGFSAQATSAGATNSSQAGAHITDTSHTAGLQTTATSQGSTYNTNVTVTHGSAIGGGITGAVQGGSANAGGFGGVAGFHF